MAISNVKYTLDELKGIKSVDQETGMKVCTGCNETKHFSNFHIHRNGRLDYNTGERRLKIESKCHVCLNEVNKQRYHRHKTGAVRINNKNVMPDSFDGEFLLQKFWKGFNPIDLLGVQ